MPYDPERHGPHRIVGPGFHGKVHALVKKVPAGRVTTYGDVAEALGSRSVARQVGFAMAAVGDDDVPWWRVVAAGGRLAARSVRVQTKALRAEEMLQGEIKKLQLEQQAAADRGRNLKMPGAADIDGLLSMHRYALQLVAQQKQLAAQLLQVQAECERRRLALVDADRGVRVLEKLRERRAQDYGREQLRREARELDEVGILGFIQARQETST